MDEDDAPATTTGLADDELGLPKGTPQAPLANAFNFLYFLWLSDGVQTHCGPSAAWLLMRQRNARSDLGLLRR